MDSAPTPNATSLMQLRNQSIPNPRNQARSASSRGGADYDSICKEIDAEDVGATPPCGLPAAMDSAPTPNATSLMHSGINLFQAHGIKQDLQVQEEEQILIQFERRLMLRM